MSASEYTESDALTYYLKPGTSVTRPTAIYLSLHTAALGDDGSGAEVSGNGYARVNITSNFASASVATDGTGKILKNSTDITGFTNTSGGNWGTVVHVGIWDAATSGNLLFHADLASDVAIAAGDSFQISANNLTIKLD